MRMGTQQQQVHKSLMILKKRTEARRPVLRPWICTAEVRDGGGGSSLWELGHNNNDPESA